MIGIDTLSGILAWDGRVLEHFDSEGRDGYSWRLHGSLIRSTEIERRKDRLFVRVQLTDRFYESFAVGFDQEAVIDDLLSRVRAG